METDNSKCAIVGVKSESMESKTFPKASSFGYSYVEIDYKKAVAIKEEECEDATGIITETGIVPIIKLNLGDDKAGSCEQGNASESCAGEKLGKIFTGEKRNYNCEIDSQLFATKGILPSHINERPNQNMLRHRKCFPSNQIRLRNADRTRNYKCEICGKCYTTKQVMLTHMGTHCSKRNYKCEICSKWFTLKQYMLRHMKFHTDEKNFKCEICDKSFVSRQYMLLHKEAHKGENKCAICNKSFTTKHTMLRHVKSHTGERNHECEICGKHFLSRSYMLRHLEAHTSQRNKCEICAKCFTTNQSMLRHMQTHTGERNYKCNVCDKAFTRKQYMLRHVDAHTPLKNHKCEICFKCYLTEELLSQHVVTHKRKGKFECEICGSFFTTKISMLRHVQKYAGEKNCKRENNESLIKEEIVKENYLENENDTTETSKVTKQRGVGSVKEEEPMSIGIFNLRETLNSEITIKEENLMDTSLLMDADI